MGNIKLKSFADKSGWLIEVGKLLAAVVVAVWSARGVMGDYDVRLTRVEIIQQTQTNALIEVKETISRSFAEIHQDLANINTALIDRGKR